MEKFQSHRSKFVNTSTVEVDARGVIVVAEDSHLTETTQKLNTKNSSNALPKCSLKGNVG